MVYIYTIKMNAKTTKIKASMPAAAGD